MSKNLEKIFSVGEYSWENIAQKQIELYEKIFNQ